jgi:hypothetical protein
MNDDLIEPALRVLSRLGIGPWGLEILSQPDSSVTSQQKM